VEPTPLPAPIEAVHLLALLTRVRAGRVASGELDARRLYDVRAMKCAFAELGYLRRLAAAGRTGGTVVTSMPQLVTGLAALHPAWKLTGDAFEDRDRHHQAVRRRLRDLEAMGLLRWRVGVDGDGEERRTEIELVEGPAVTVDELEEAASRLRCWQARYGSALNTGSSTGIRNAARHGRPLSDSERQRRGCQQTRAAASRRKRAHQTNSTPPSGASATPQDNPPLSNRNVPALRNACPRTGVTRVNGHGPANLSATPEPVGDDKTTGSEDGGGAAVAGSLASVSGVLGSAADVGGRAWDPEALIARVRAREAQRAPVIAAIAKSAQARAVEVATWGLDRGWPFSRLREAWVVARYGATVAADSGAGGAGPLYGEDYARLRRAVARYQRNQSAAPDGYPDRGLGALLHIGSLAGAGELAHAPRTLRYAIGALDQLSRRMRAIATADSAKRHQSAANRTQRRRNPPPRAYQLTFRTTAWPRWILTDGRQEPLFDQHGVLQLDESRVALAPAPHTDAYRTVIRDAHLLAGHQLPLELDGRRQMALRYEGELEPAQRPKRPSVEQLELRELSHRTGQPLSLLRQISPTYREAWLTQARQRDAVQARADALSMRAALAALHQRPPQR
jgi:hypothetical protein